MTEEKASVIATSPTLNINKSGDYKSIYVNWVQSSLTPFDISLIVGEALAVGQLFSMSKPKLVSFLIQQKPKSSQGLAQSVELYEDQFGPLPVAHVTTNVVVQAEPKESTEGD
jgi:hypothetical protein